MTSQDPDPLALVRLAAAEYAAIEDGYRAQLLQFLETAYRCYRLFRDFPDDFAELLEDPFWDISRQKPKKKLTTARFVLYYIMRAETKSARARASKYAKILDCFHHDGVRVGQVAARIRALHGIEAAYEHFVAIARGLPMTTVDAADEESEDERPLTVRRGKLRASGDVQVQGEEIDAESGSSSETGLDDLFDPEKDLSIRLGSETLEQVLGPEIDLDHSFYLECRKKGPLGRDGILIIGRWVDPPTQ